MVKAISRNNIQALRLKQGMTQEEFIRRVKPVLGRDISVTTLSKHENGLRNPGSDVQQAYAHVLGVPTYTLYSDIVEGTGDEQQY